MSWGHVQYCYWYLFKHTYRLMYMSVYVTNDCILICITLQSLQTHTSNIELTVKSPL